MIVFVNGLFADLTSFDGACFYLRGKFEFLRYDCRGQGKSPKPESIYTLEDHVSDLFELVNHLKLKKIILVGLSNGGRIALAFTKKYPFLVEALVVCDSFDIVSPLLKQKLLSWLVAHEKGGATLRFDVATPWIWGEDVFREKGELILSYRNKAEKTESYVAKNLILGALGPDIEISSIEVPTLLIVGAQDLLTPVFYHEAMLKKLKKATLQVVEGGHASMIERPTIMDKYILPWIESL